MQGLARWFVAASAALRAPLASSVTKAFTVFSLAAMTSRQRSRNSRGVRLPDSISGNAAANDVMLGFFQRFNVIISVKSRRLQRGFNSRNCTGRPAPLSSAR